LLELSALCLSL